MVKSLLCNLEDKFSLRESVNYQQESQFLWRLISRPEVVREKMSDFQEKSTGPLFVTALQLREDNKWGEKIKRYVTKANKNIQTFQYKLTKIENWWRL